MSPGYRHTDAACEELRDAGVRGLHIERELWTTRQRSGHRLHEVSYRACFKPQRPNFFITRLTQPGDRVLDPFSGRGTTAVEAALLDCRVAANDINPLSEMLARPPWLRCWFNGIDAQAVAARRSAHRSLSVGRDEMAVTLRALFRITGPGGHVAFEVGEVRNGEVKLDEIISPSGGSRSRR